MEFGGFAQAIGGTAFPFLRKHIVTAAKSVAADLLDFAVPETADVFSCGISFKTATKSVARQNVEKRMGSVSKKKRAVRVISTESAKQSTRSRKNVFLNISHY